MQKSLDDDTRCRASALAMVEMLVAAGYSPTVYTNVVLTRGAAATPVFDPIEVRAYELKLKGVNRLVCSRQRRGLTSSSIVCCLHDATLCRLWHVSKCPVAMNIC
jgi:hypothetical protein